MPCLVTYYQEAGEHEEKVGLRILFTFVMIFKASVLGNHFDQHTEKISWELFLYCEAPSGVVISFRMMLLGGHSL